MTLANTVVVAVVVGDPELRAGSRSSGDEAASGRLSNSGCGKTDSGDDGSSSVACSERKTLLRDGSDSSDSSEGRLRGQLCEELPPTERRAQKLMIAVAAVVLLSWTL